MKHAFRRNGQRDLAGLLTASVLALAACGGGGGGDEGGGGGLPNGTFTRTFSNAENFGLGAPFWNGSVGDVTAQFLYLAAEVGGSGKITALRFRSFSSSPAAVTCPNTTIRLGHSNLTNLTAAYAGNMNVGTPRVVLTNATLTIPAAGGEWFEIVLATPFDYNGTDHLVVQVDRTTTCSGQKFVNVRSTVANRLAISVATDTTPGTADNDTTTGMLLGHTGWMQFVFGGGDNRLDFTGANGNSLPFSNTAASSGRRTQHLYLASEINGSGPVTGIAFQTHTATVSGTYAYTLRLGHSTLTALGANFAGNYAGSPTTVADAVTNFTIPANIPAGDWIWVPIPDGLFTYNGTDNLIVDVSVPSGTANNALRNLAAATSRRVFNSSDAAATTGIVDDFAYHIALRFRGGPMIVATPTGMTGGAADIFPFFDTDGKRQYLYLATELGTRGAISKLACRAGIVLGPAGTGFNYTVVLGHSTASTLGATYASNLTSPVTVFNGTLSIPATVVGDWVEIPFTAPFAYNGKDNLVVQLSGTGGTGNAVACALDIASTARYVGRRVNSSMSTDTAGIVSNFVTDMRFTLN